MTRAIAAAITEIDPDGAATYAAGAEAFGGRLQVLHERIAASLAACASRTIVTSHRAFGYFADRYGLDQLPIAGVSPAAEPDPRSMEAIAQAARERDVRTIFYESVVPRAFAETIAGEIGAAVDALEPVETLTEDQLAIGLDYLTLMDQNRAALVRGLPCFGE
jgi:zinc transport system substrate-binding protein